MSKKYFHHIVFICLLVNFPTLNINGENIAENQPDATTGVDIESVNSIKPGITEIRIVSSKKETAAKIPVTIYTPPGKTIRGNILLLPGWKHSRLRWLNETNIKEHADNNGFRLICPEMNITVYESKYFPETTLKWADTPGLQWIHDFLIPAMRTKGIFLTSQNNFILGLSTGARGAALVTLDNPSLFSAAAAFSGDFDQTKMPEDKLMTAVYGSFKQFPDRWLLIDNPVQMARKWNTPLYLAHGTKDEVVPISQSRLFYATLSKLHLLLDITINMPEEAHNYLFWGSQSKIAMQFFNEYVNKNKVENVK